MDILGTSVLSIVQRLSIVPSLVVDVYFKAGGEQF